MELPRLFGVISVRRTQAALPTLQLLFQVVAISGICPDRLALFESYFVATFSNAILFTAKVRCRRNPHDAV